jgi:REP element-mobilizing transposase RayT
MPRKARIDTVGALHHIIVRGIERRKIFYDDIDRDNFLNRLGAILTDTKTPCFAWALIPNHLHLLLRTGVAPIATVMRRLLTGYAISFNRRHRSYREYVKKGIDEGKRTDLTGGGLIRSAGGWSVVKALRKSDARMKGDERILGDGDFVETVLKEVRGLLCYWGTRGLRMTTVELAKKLNLAQPTISQSSMRGRIIAKDEGLNLLE